MQPVAICRLPRLRGLASNRALLPSRLDLAGAGGLQQGQAVARGLLGIQVALSLVFDLQAGPFVGIDGLEIGSVELAIRRWLRRQQRQVRSPDPGRNISIWLGVSAGTHESTDRRRFAFVRGRTDFTLRRIARAAGEQHRAQNDGDGGQKYWNARFHAGSAPRRACALQGSPGHSAASTIAMPMIPVECEPGWRN